MVIKHVKVKNDILFYKHKQRNISSVCLLLHISGCAEMHVPQGKSQHCPLFGLFPYEQLFRNMNEQGIARIVVRFHCFLLRGNHVVVT